MNVKKKMLRKKFVMYSKGLKGAPSNTLKLFSAKKKFLSIFIKMDFIPFQNFFHRNMLYHIGTARKYWLHRPHKDHLPQGKIHPICNSPLHIVVTLEQILKEKTL